LFTPQSIFIYYTFQFGTKLANISKIKSKIKYFINMREMFVSKNVFCCIYVIMLQKATFLISNFSFLIPIYDATLRNLQQSLYCVVEFSATSG